MRRARVSCKRRASASWRLLRGDKQPVDVAFGQDALRQGVLEFGPLDDAADIERQVGEAVAEAKQRFHRRDLSRARTGGEVLEGVHPGLDISQCHRAQRLAHEGDEAVRVGTVGALGVRAAAMQPELEQVRVAVDLSDGRQHIRRKRPPRRPNYVEQICHFTR